MKYTEIADIISGGTPKTSCPDYWDGDIPWLSVVDFSDCDKYVYTTEKSITEEGLNNSSTKLLQKDDIIISARGTIGAMAMILYPMAFNQSCFGIRAKACVDSHYLFYLTQIKIKELQTKSKNGNIFKSINLDTFEYINIDLPTLEEQKKVAKVLSDIDRKISLNRSINAELERMAKEVYDYWFVQFDFPDEHGRPYKSSGGAMVYNPVLKREVPEGWEVKTIGDEALIRRGSVITEKEALAGNVKVVAAGINYSYMHNQSNRKANVITISTSGANAGYMNFWREPIYASDCMTIECDNDVNTLICYYNLWHFREIMLRSACGSAQPHVYPYHIEPLPFIKATNSIIKKFEDVVIPINKDIAKNEKEIEELTALRDELLPLLMTGQVEVI